MSNDFQAWLCEPIKRRGKKHRVVRYIQYIHHSLRLNITKHQLLGHTYIGTIIHIPTASTTKKRFICMSRTFLSTCLNTKRIIHFFLCFLNEVIKITMCSIQVKSSNARTYLIKGWQKNQFSCVDINNCYPLARWESNKALLPTDLETVMYSQSLMNALTRHYYSS